MNSPNNSEINEFILLGFSDVKEVQIVLFVIFLVMYILTFTQHATIIIVIHLDYHLHTPMYYFINNLSFLEISYITVTIPKFLSTLITRTKTISIHACFSQLYMFFFLGTTECYLLTAMAYDRYLAICDPLHYNKIMNRRVCFKFAGGCWLAGFFSPLIPTTFISQLRFCGSNIINHFFCETPSLLKLSCQNINTIEIISFILGSLILLTSFIFTLVSYINIIAMVLKIHTSDGRSKAFSTCTSHLIIVSLFYGTTIFTYVRPKTINSFNFNKSLSLIYSVITPMVNPLIYSLRNNDIKLAIKKKLSI
ncbi:olfactory receptor 6N2-like [Gastrophryne carolinensis]